MNENPIREIFLGEAKEILANLETDLVRLEEHWDGDLVNSIFRYIHTLKGSSGIAGFTSVYEFTHRLESLLDMVRSGKLPPDEKLIDLLLGSLDWIREGIAIEGAENAPLEERKIALIADAEAYMHPVTAAAGVETGAISEKEMDAEKEVGYGFFRVKVNFRENIFESGIDPLMLLEDMASLGTITEKKVDRKALPSLSAMDPEKCYLRWEFVLKTKHPLSKVEEVFLFVRGDNEIVIEDISVNYQAVEKKDEYIEEKRIGEILVTRGILTEKELADVLSMQDIKNKRIGDLVVEKGYATEKEIQFALGEQEKIKKRVETSTVRVDTGKLDNLLNLLGEIVIGQSGISRIADELDEEKGFRLKNALYSLDRTTREFQEQIMSIRMIPIGPTFEQFRRFVRDSAHALSKEIHLEIEGGETELDKTVIERISDPLKHMIRNAIDHGIEPPAEREATGKPRTGLITIRAYHQEGNVYIEVSDDGRGMNKATIRAKAESMGIIKPGEEVGEVRLLSFLFLPGFSTAEKIGDLSGRGVGMDVVKTNIESLRGIVEIETDAGKGSTFRIKMPLTLAIIEGMLVRVGSNVYIIPLLSIVESVQPKRDDIRTVKEKGEVLQVRNEYVSLVRLHELFGVESDFRDPWESLVVVVEAGMSRVGVMIDELLGQQQIVIKSIENYITRSRAISGAAIMGDGRVALIIDVHGLVEEMVK